MDNNQVTPTNDGEKTPGKAIACLILGICSIVFSCGGIGLICAIIGLVLNGQLAKEMGEVPQQAKIGKILCIVGLVLTVIAVIALIIMSVAGAAIAGAGGGYSY